MNQDGHAPLPSEQTLFAVWGTVERVRNRE
jgi:hypothetical protein